MCDLKTSYLNEVYAYVKHDNMWIMINEGVSMVRIGGGVGRYLSIAQVGMNGSLCDKMM